MHNWSLLLEPNAAQTWDQTETLTTYNTESSLIPGIILSSKHLVSCSDVHTPRQRMSGGFSYISCHITHINYMCAHWPYQTPYRKGVSMLQEISLKPPDLLCGGKRKQLGMDLQSSFLAGGSMSQPSINCS